VSGAKCPTDKRSVLYRCLFLLVLLHGDTFIRLFLGIDDAHIFRYLRFFISSFSFLPFSLYFFINDLFLSFVNWGLLFWARHGRLVSALNELAVFCL
jgi:hypothetical protein